MNKVAIAAGVGVVAGLVVAGVYFGAPYAGFHIDLSLLVATAAILAFGSSIAGFTLSALDKQTAGSIGGSTRLSEDPVHQFVVPFDDREAIQVFARPGIPSDMILMRLGRLLTDPEQHAHKRIVLTLKKAKKGGEIFNPVVLKELFEKLKPFKHSQHIILRNEHDEFAGYIPWAKAVKDFTGGTAETRIRENIVDVLNDPAVSKKLRLMDGMGAQDIISDTATIHEAAFIASRDKDDDGEENVLHGLVVCHRKRNRKPIGVIDKKGIVQLINWGA
jgi:hypothetical protein